MVPVVAFKEVAEVKDTVGATIMAPVVLINSTLGIETKFVPAIVRVSSVVGYAIKEEVVMVGRSPSPVGMVPEAPNAIVCPFTVIDELTNLSLAIVVLAILAFVIAKSSMLSTLTASSAKLRFNILLFAMYPSLR